MNKLATTPNGEDVVSMVVHKDILIVATASTVYQLSESGVFTVIKFEVKEDEVFEYKRHDEKINLKVEDGES